MIQKWLMGRSTQGQYWMELVLSEILNFVLSLLWVACVIYVLFPHLILPVEVFWLLSCVITRSPICCVVLRRGRGANKELLAQGICLLIIMGTSATLNDDSFGFPGAGLWNILSLCGAVGLGFVPGYHKEPDQGQASHSEGACVSEQGFLLAVADNDMEKVKEILSRNPQAVQQVDPGTGNTALHVAAWNGLAEMVDFLAQNGANMEAKNKAGLTAEELWDKKFPPSK